MLLVAQRYISADTLGAQIIYLGQYTISGSKIYLGQYTISGTKIYHGRHTLSANNISRPIRYMQLKDISRLTCLECAYILHGCWLARSKWKNIYVGRHWLVRYMRHFGTYGNTLVT